MADTNNQAGKTRRVRLFVDAPFAAGAELLLARAQAHYLGNVMRFKPGDTLAIFNGCDGEWRAAIAEMRRDTCTLVAESETRPQQAATGPVLLFAPLKPTRSAMLIRKGVRIGGFGILADIHATQPEQADQAGPLPCSRRRGRRTMRSDGRAAGAAARIAR